MNIFKKISSLNYKKDILPLQMLKEPDKILILFPIDHYRSDLIVPAITTLKNKFSSSDIIGITSEDHSLSIRNSRLFNEVICYDTVPKLFSRRFFKLRTEIRNLQADISIDLNLENDLLTWISGAGLRIGCILSPFINYRIKLKEIENKEKISSEEVANKIIKILCTSR
ncbi:MAG: hypothetical protein WC614_12285 [bacterium]